MISMCVYIVCTYIELVLNRLPMTLTGFRPTQCFAVIHNFVVLLAILSLRF